MAEPKNIAHLARKKLYSNLLAKLNAGKTLTVCCVFTICLLTSAEVVNYIVNHAT